MGKVKQHMIEKESEEPMEKLILRGSEWLRGKDSESGENSYLWRDDDNKKCCLGIYLHYNVGIDEIELADNTVPENLDCPEKVPAWMLGKNEDGDYIDNYVVNQIIKINDDGKIDDWERVKKLRPLFAQQGIELEFRPDE